MDSTTTMRAAMRNGTDPKTKINWMGFRCAQDANEGASSVSYAVPTGEEKVQSLSRASFERRVCSGSVTRISVTQAVRKSFSVDSQFSRRTASVLTPAEATLNACAP